MFFREREICLPKTQKKRQVQSAEPAMLVLQCWLFAARARRGENPLSREATAKLRHFSDTRKYIAPKSGFARSFFVPSTDFLPRPTTLVCGLLFAFYRQFSV